MPISHDAYRHISKINEDPIVERRVCSISGEEFPIFAQDQKFINTISPKIGDTQYLLPLPTLAPKTRQQQRMLHRNERTLYRRRCSATNKEIISIHRPETPFPVYHQDMRWADSRDALDYAQDIDLTKSFFDQYKDLQDKVPRPSLVSTNTENGQYSNFSGYNNNVYMAFATRDCENALYTKRSYRNTNIVDVLDCYGTDVAYECVSIKDCYQCFFAHYSKDCKNCAFIWQCYNCSHCLMCTNLNTKEYCIANKQYTKEEYLLAKEKILGSYSAFQEALSTLQGLVTQSVHQATVGTNNDQSFGNDLYDCSACVVAFSAEACEACRYVLDVTQCVSCHDCEYTIKNSEYCYMIEGSTTVTHSAFNVTGFFNSHSRYSSLCMSCHHIFGCIGLRNKEYCIFNKQYTKDEYEKKVSDLIAHMIQTEERGQFFPAQHSPFAYNETIAQEYYPLDQIQAKQHGFNRYHATTTVPVSDKSIPASQLPNDINSVSDDIISQAIICPISNKPFRITKQELEFYRKYQLPLPHYHPDIRHQQRLQQRGALTLHLRTCSQSGQDIVSVYDETAPFPVYSEEAYTQLMFG